MRRMVVPTRLWAAAYSLLLGGAGLALWSYVSADKAALENKAAERALFDATLAASGLDATLRVASLGISRIDAAEIPQHSDAERLAFSLPEATNIYLLAPDGEVVWTAFRRADPTVAFGSDIFERLRAGSILECLIVDAPAEGGEVLALAKRLTGGAVAVAMFNAWSLSRSVSTSLRGSQSGVTLADGSGRRLELAGAPRPDGPGAETRLGSSIDETVFLASVPISITVSADMEDDRRAWLRRTMILSALGVALVLTSGAMTLLGINVYRRRMRVMDLKKALDDKETMYREVNHRVKNNLTIIQTVLELGSDEITEHPDRALPVVRSSIDRLRAVSLLHELLYRQGAGRSDDVGEYMSELAAALSSAYDLGERVSIVERHDSEMACGLDRMVPIALIVNELVANACKYAFPDGRRGTILLESSRAIGGGFDVIVKDDGVGMSNDAPRSGGIGAMLIEALAGQVGARLERDEATGTGVAWRLSVPAEARSKSA